MSDRYLTLVERFVAVAEEGTIQGAAKRLNLSQPSLTQSVRRIEEIFECKLFERTKKGVILTLTGELLFQRSRRMLEHSNLAHEEISDLVAGRAGSLRIVAGTVWATRYLPTIIRDLQAVYPDLLVALDISLTPDGLRLLHRGDVDLVVGGVYDELKPNYGFTKETLISQRYAVGCGRRSPLAKLKNVSIRQVADHPLVLFHDDELLMSRVINEIEHEQGIKFKRAVLTKSVLVALEMVIEGPYVLFLGEAMFRRFEFAGIHIINLEQPLHTFETAMFYRDSLRQTEPFNGLLAALRDQVG